LTVATLLLLDRHVSVRVLALLGNIVAVNDATEPTPTVATVGMEMALTRIGGGDAMVLEPHPVAKKLPNINRHAARGPPKLR